MKVNNDLDMALWGLDEAKEKGNDKLIVMYEEEIKELTAAGMTPNNYGRKVVAPVDYKPEPRDPEVDKNNAFVSLLKFARSER